MIPKRGAGRRREVPRVVVCDFDGTITDVDTGELALTNFSKGDWRQFHREYLDGAYPFEECLRRQYAQMRRTPKESILGLVDRSVRVRPGFEELLARAESAGVPVVVASYGLDFCIEHVLSAVKGGSDLQVFAPKTTEGADGLRLSFPRRRLEGSANLKDDVVGWYKRRGREVIFVGDGASDLPAAEKADASFAIEGSELARLCEGKGIGITKVTTFRPVADAFAPGAALGR